jgi:hypothetical protein
MQGMCASGVRPKTTARGGFGSDTIHSADDTPGHDGALQMPNLTTTPPFVVSPKPVVVLVVGV